MWAPPSVMSGPGSLAWKSIRMLPGSPIAKTIRLPWQVAAAGNMCSGGRFRTSVMTRAPTGIRFPVRRWIGTPSQRGLSIRASSATSVSVSESSGTSGRSR